MTDVTMIDLCKATLPKIYSTQADIVEIERLRAAGYLIADEAVLSHSRRDVTNFQSITVYSVTPTGRAIVSTFRPGNHVTGGFRLP
jgi:hypothetical protein